VWEYATSGLFTDAERVALDLAVAASSIPNAASDELFAELGEHWSDEQIVEIMGVIALFGFLNRWNDTFATELEGPSRESAERLLGDAGWEVGKHA
jgi:alkylhydroperoxidase family enzyme